MSNVLTRFAPSPTGRLHLGHAASAFHVWQLAEEKGGHALLRIEDIDTTRCRPGLTEAIFEDLAWLGFKWPEPVRLQSEHFVDYGCVVENLAQRGLAYRCFRTRTDVQTILEETGKDVYIGSSLAAEEEAERIAGGEPFAWRLSLSACRDLLGVTWNRLTYEEETPKGRVTHKAEPERHGDIVIARKDSPSAYHIAATHDDALQGITDVVRGTDLIEAPHIQTLLQHLMDWPKPVYHHHALILGTDGKKLSKQQNALSLAEIRSQGMTPEDIRRRLGLG